MNDDSAETIQPPAMLPAPKLSFDGPRGPLFKALAEARKSYRSLTADSKAEVELKGGGGYKHQYADLDTVIKALSPGWEAAGICVMQPFDGDTLFTIVAVGDSSMMVESPLPTWQTPQQLGSLLTYLRRYQLKGLFCVNDAEDDDGNAAEGNKATITRKEPTTTKPSSGPKMTDSAKNAITLAGKEKGLDKDGFIAAVKAATGGKSWGDCTAEDAPKILEYIQGAA